MTVSDGVKVGAYVRGPERAPVLVFLHGFPQSPFCWRSQVAALSSNFRTVAIEMRGYGDSDKPQSTGSYLIERLALDVKEVAASIIGPGKKFVLVG